MSETPNVVRRQIYDLTNEDLLRFSIWEFASDEEAEQGQDEATVRPWDGEPPPDRTCCPLIVRARFILADGTRHSGHVTFDVQGTSINSVHPAIITEAGQVTFWYGIQTPSREAMNTAYARLGRTAAFVFPIRYISDVPLAADPIAGSVEGFCHYRSLRDRTIVTLV